MGVVLLPCDDTPILINYILLPAIVVGPVECGT